MIKCGTYLGDKIQAVVTNLYTIVFCIEEKCILSYMLKTIDMSCIHMVRTMTHMNGNTAIDYLLTSQGRMNYVKGKSFIELINKTVFEIMKQNDEYIWISHDGKKYVSMLNEIFEKDYLSSRCIAATKNTIADCLKDWHLGVKILKTGTRNKTCLQGVEINTPLNMYLFKVGYNNIYIRAARYAACNTGIVFQQNFRQFLNYNYCQHSTIDSFLNVTKPLPEPDANSFCNYCCTIQESNCYWSVKHYDENRIFLNGCGDETYTFLRPI